MRFRIERRPRGECEKRLTSPRPAGSVGPGFQTVECRMIHRNAIINLIRLIIVIVGVIIGDDDKGSVMA
jgi:hypothetical protein